MQDYNEEMLREIAEIPYEKKVERASAAYTAIMDYVNSDACDASAEEVNKSICILVANIVFSNYCFSPKESEFLEEATWLKRDAINGWKHDCEEYLYDALQVFKTHLTEKEREHLAEIVVTMVTVDGHSSKNEVRLMNKFRKYFA